MPTYNGIEITKDPYNSHLNSYLLKKDETVVSFNIDYWEEYVKGSSKKLQMNVFGVVDYRIVGGGTRSKGRHYGSSLSTKRQHFSHNSQTNISSRFNSCRAVAIRILS